LEFGGPNIRALIRCLLFTYRESMLLRLWIGVRNKRDQSPALPPIRYFEVDLNDVNLDTLGGEMLQVTRGRMNLRAGKQTNLSIRQLLLIPTIRSNA
jgi:hypothetical protein